MPILQMGGGVDHFFQTAKREQQAVEELRRLDLAIQDRPWRKDRTEGMCAR